MEDKKKYQKKISNNCMSPPAALYFAIAGTFWVRDIRANNGGAGSFHIFGRVYACLREFKSQSLRITIIYFIDVMNVILVGYRAGAGAP